MVNEYIRYRIDADRTDDFLKAYEEAGALMRASPYCLGYERHYQVTPLRWSR